VYAILLVLQMIISVLLVVGILLQSSKGGGLAGIAGGMASSTVFGGRGAATFLSKATTILATLFFLNCLGMAVMSTRMEQRASVTQQSAAQQETPVSPVPEVPGGATINPNAVTETPADVPVLPPNQPEPKKAEGQ
jgi:preprotein translocase subunit SecG